MAIIVRNNMPVVQAVNMAAKSSAAFGKSLLRVSSGMRINNAADDTSGYSISERMQVMMRGLDQDTRNAQTGNSLLKVAQGAVSSTVEILKTLKEKAINAANDTNTDADRAMIQKELDQAIDQINDNANVTFNGKLLMDGSKNAKTEGTFTALTNQSLAKTTTGATRLVDLADRRDANLGIQIGDTVSVSYVQNGKTYSTSFAVTATSSLATIMLEAEKIDETSQAFADVSNMSIMKINGVTDPETALEEHKEKVRLATEKRDEMKGYYESYKNGEYKDAADAVTQAEEDLQIYYKRMRELDDSYNALMRDFPALIDNFAANVGSSAATLQNYRAEFASWKQDGENITGFWHPYPSGKAWSEGGYSYLIRFLNQRLKPERSETIDDARTLMNSVTRYISAHNAAFGAGYNENSEGNLIESIANKKNILAEKQTELNKKQADWDDAQAALDALIAPQILDGTKIGVDYYGNVQTTANNENALTITAMNVGTEGQIAGFTISVSGTDGNIKKSVNAALDDWNETIRAQNARDEDDSLILQTGTRPSQAVKVQLTDMRASALGLQGSDGSNISVATQEKANAAINAIDNALKKAIEQQTSIGAMGSRLGYTSSNLQVASENVQASGSTIRDADMAKEMTTHTKDRVLLRSSQLLLAQSNHQSYEVLSLLR